MINSSLLNILIERNIVTIGTEFDAAYRGIDMAKSASIKATGTFVILEIARSDVGFYFKAADVVTGKPFSVSASSIIRIDGMEPDRLAAIYGLSPEGEKLKQGKRRGRKPRVAREEMGAE